MSAYSIIFKHDYLPSQITFTEVPSSRKIDPILEASCKARWVELIHEAKESGKQIWDSETYRFELAQVGPDGLSLVLSTIPFSIWRSMNFVIDKVQQLGLSYSSKGMYSSCFFLTSDGKYVFIEDSGKYLNRRPIMFIGGVLSKSEKELKSGFDLFNEAEKEVIEEAGAHQEDIESTVLNAGYITESYNICLIFTIKLSITFDQLVERFNQNNDGEAKGLIGITKSGLSEFAKQLNKKELPKFELMGLI